MLLWKYLTLAVPLLSGTLSGEYLVLLIFNMTEAKTCYIVRLRAVPFSCFLLYY
jgi:hypothetical protein